MKKLAIIGGGGMACIFAKNAREMGIETHCYSLESGILDREGFDYIHPVNILNREKVLELCISHKIDAVVSTTELTIAVAAFVADRMNLIGVPIDVAEVITDKYRNRRVTKHVEELRQPKYEIVNGIEEIVTLDFEYPIILKPTSKGGKRGVTVINNAEDIEDAYSYAIHDAGEENPLIVEEFIDSDMECSVESLSYCGQHYIIQITEKITSGAPHCVELAHHQPPNLPNKIKAKIERVLVNALTAIGIENGACHTEIKIKGDELYLIEFNARPGGDHIADPLIELSTGYSYIKGAIEISFGEFKGIDKSKFLNRHAGVLFVTDQTPELKDIFDKCENYSWCYKKHYVSKDFNSIIHNDGFNKNYFIYCNEEERPEFTILKEK